MNRPRSGATRKAIVDAAIDLFVAKGREGVSVQEICAASGISNGSLFHHFGSKNGVALAVYLEVREEYWDAALSAMEAHQGDPLEAMGEAARAAMAYQQAHAGRFNFMMECGSADWMREYGEPVRALNDRIAGRWIQWAGPHLQEGRLPLLPPEVYPAIIFGASQWLARSWQTGLTEMQPLDYAKVLVPMVVKALRPD